LDAGGPLWSWGAAAVATAFLAITGGLLLWDLEHPLRVYMIFTRPQWRSWLVRGAFIISGFGAVLALHLLAALAGWSGLPQTLVGLGIPLGALTAVYTAYLFGQAKGRDLWQNPLLPPHFLVQAFVAGSAALLPVAAASEPSALPGLLWLLSASSFVHLLMVAGETTVTHGTAHAHLAVWQLTRGRYGLYFWIGTLLVTIALAAPWIGTMAGASALVGLLAYEHAYVQAGQAVPLA
ncbi:MAG: polysulfide reductase NrfD, partial [Gemmatimonadales bacterium]